MQALTLTSRTIAMPSSPPCRFRVHTCHTSTSTVSRAHSISAIEHTVMPAEKDIAPCSEISCHAINSAINSACRSRHTAKTTHPAVDSRCPRAPTRNCSSQCQLCVPLVEERSCVSRLLSCSSVCLHAVTDVLCNKFQAPQCKEPIMQLQYILRQT